MVCVMTASETGEADEVLAIARLRTDLANGRARGIRENARLSQAEIARALGVDQPTVARWEGGTMPRRHHATRYAELLGRLSRLSEEATP